MAIRPHTDRRARTVWQVDVRDKDDIRRRFLVDTRDEAERIEAKASAGEYVHD